MAKREKRQEKRMAFLVATTSLPAVDRLNADRAGTPHARANVDIYKDVCRKKLVSIDEREQQKSLREYYKQQREKKNKQRIKTIHKSE